MRIRPPRTLPFAVALLAPAPNAAFGRRGSGISHGFNHGFQHPAGP